VVVREKRNLLPLRFDHDDDDDRTMVVNNKIKQGVKCKCLNVFYFRPFLSEHLKHWRFCLSLQHLPYGGVDGICLRHVSVCGT
jgi:hypothetical protein